MRSWCECDGLNWPNVDWSRGLPCTTNLQKLDNGELAGQDRERNELLPARVFVPLKRKCEKLPFFFVSHSCLFSQFSPVKMVTPVHCRRHCSGYSIDDRKFYNSREMIIAKGHNYDLPDSLLFFFFFLLARWPF